MELEYGGQNLNGKAWALKDLSSQISGGFNLCTPTMALHNTHLTPRTLLGNYRNI